jgi:protein-disulfide isomerase
MNKMIPIVALVCLTFASTFSQGLRASPSDDDLRTEIEALKKGQADILKQLEEIRKLVTPKQREVVSDIDVTLDIAGDPVKGSPDAKVALIEFTDYQCPFCGRNEKTVMPQVIKDYVDTGKVRYVLRDFPLPFHKNARNAAFAAHCAGEQGKYWEMHDLLFQNQQALEPEKLSAYAATLKLDTAAFDECMKSDRYAGKVTASLQDGNKATVQGTPSLVVGVMGADGKVKGTKIIRGAVPYAVFKSTLDAMLTAGKTQPEAKAND